MADPSGAPAPAKPKPKPAPKGPIAQARGLSLGPKAKAPVVVVTLCKDRPEVVRSFVRQQLALGASELRIYFDDPDDPALPWAAAQPGVVAVACDAAFWEGMNWYDRPTRPPHIEARQSATSTHAYATIPADHWAGFCDIDELFVPHTDFTTMLATIGPEVEQVRAEVAEAIWAPGEGGEALKSASLARLPVRDKKILEPLIRRRTPLFRTFSNKGLMGHISGKAMVRGGMPDLALNIHFHKRKAADGTLKPLVTALGDMTLLHFDALSYEIWCTKHLRRLAKETAIGGNPSHRSAQTDLFGLCTHEEGRRSLFAQFYGSAPDYLREMQKVDALLRLDDADKVES